MNPILSPCYDVATKTSCPKRKEGCSITCEKWAEYEKQRAEVYRQRIINAQANSVIIEGSVRRATKCQKKTMADRAGRGRGGKNCD
jgi:hypothetical protein